MTPLTDTQVAEALARLRAYLAEADRVGFDYIVDWRGSSDFTREDLRTLLALADEADARKDAR